MNERLQAFISRIRTDGKLDLALRPVGSQERLRSAADTIFHAIEGAPLGIIPVGDKSSPAEISAYFHGMSKNEFKSSIGRLFKSGLVKPGDYTTQLLSDQEKQQKTKQTFVDDLNKKYKKPLHTLFIGNLPFNINEATLQNIVNKQLGADKVISLRLCREKTDKLDENNQPIYGKPKGFGFLDFSSKEALEEAFVKLKNYEINGRNIRVDRTDAAEAKTSATSATPMDKTISSRNLVKPSPTNKPLRPTEWWEATINDNLPKDLRGPEMTLQASAVLYVGNLPYAVDEEMLKQHIERQIGGAKAVAKVRIIKDKLTGRKRGFGYVDLVDEKYAEIVRTATLTP